MNNGHIFNFDGGDILAGIGATWFVSYAYYENLDRSHLAWNKISTYRSRISKYENSRYYHEYWLKQVENMNNLNLAKNQIGISPEDTKLMAKELLEFFQRN